MEIKRILNEWDIDTKSILLAVSDNAANMTGTIADLQLRHLGCYAHKLNLTANDVFRNFKSSVAKVKQIVAYFKRSSNANAKLNEI